MSNELDILATDGANAEATDSGAAATRQTGTIAREVARRRTFGIISHPDAGKTTLT